MVVGLGRFGSALATELEVLGHEVLVVDASEAVVKRYAPEVTHAVCADATDPEVLVSLGAQTMAHAVIAIGHDVEASILATAAVADLGVPDVWAKAITDAHAHILGRVGATHVVFPERDMGNRVAHQVTGQVIDYIQIDEDFALVETAPPAKEVGRTLQEAELRRRYQVTVVSVKPSGGGFTYATPETVLESGAVLLVAGPKQAVERFSART
ncbi:TrkA family potassium uptake protein [soil metagenome]|jgi:trk system potassium uptake protein TrkA